MIAGIALTLSYIIYFQFLAGHKDYLLGISPEGIGTIGCLLNFVVTLVVSRLTPPPAQALQDFVERVRAPES